MHFRTLFLLLHPNLPSCPPSCKLGTRDLKHFILNLTESQFVCHTSWRFITAVCNRPSPISDSFLTALANSLGLLAVMLIVVFQFVEVNAKRQVEDVRLSSGTGAGDRMVAK